MHRDAVVNLGLPSGLLYPRRDGFLPAGCRPLRFQELIQPAAVSEHRDAARTVGFDLSRGWDKERKGTTGE